LSQRLAGLSPQPGLGIAKQVEARRLHPQPVHQSAVLAGSAASAGAVPDAAGSGPRETRLIRFEALEAGVAQTVFSSRFRYT